MTQRMSYNYVWTEHDVLHNGRLIIEEIKVVNKKKSIN